MLQGSINLVLEAVSVNYLEFTTRLLVAKHGRFSWILKQKI